MIIKVCGMREPENIRAIEQAGADWMGFIFFPQSARYVSHRPEYLPEQCHRIGVFVNESSENILLKAQEFVCTISSCMAGKHRNNAAN